MFTAKFKLIALLVFVVWWVAIIGFMYFKLESERSAHLKTKAQAAENEAKWQKAAADTSDKVRKLEQDYRALEQIRREERDNVDKYYADLLSKQTRLTNVASAERDRLRKSIQQARSRSGGANRTASSSNNASSSSGIDGEGARLLDLLLEIDGLAEEAAGAAVREGGRVEGLQRYILNVCLRTSRAGTTIK